MSKRYAMRFTGSGGQGVILASVILATVLWTVACRTKAADFLRR